MLNYLNSESVPKKWWKSVLARIENEVPCDGGYGTHCSNDVYELNGWLYDITYEGLTVIDIRRKKL